MRALMWDVSEGGEQQGEAIGEAGPGPCSIGGAGLLAFIVAEPPGSGDTRTWRPGLPKKARITTF